MLMEEANIVFTIPNLEIVSNLFCCFDKHKKKNLLLEKLNQNSVPTVICQV